MSIRRLRVLNAQGRLVALVLVGVTCEELLVCHICDQVGSKLKDHKC